MGSDLSNVLITESEIQARLGELAQEIWTTYEGKPLLLVGVLKGAVMVMADLMRALPGSVPMDWMAVSSYGSGTKSSGVVRILKDLDTDITGVHVLIVEDIIDSGLTLSWIRANLESRSPASVEICTLLRKPDAAKVVIDCRWVGFDIPNDFVVGYGLGSTSFRAEQGGPGDPARTKRNKGARSSVAQAGDAGGQPLSDDRCSVGLHVSTAARVRFDRALRSGREPTTHER